MAKSPEIEHLEKAVAAGAKLIAPQGQPLKEGTQEADSEPTSRQAAE